MTNQTLESRLDIIHTIYMVQGDTAHDQCQNLCVFTFSLFVIISKSSKYYKGKKDINLSHNWLTAVPRFNYHETLIYDELENSIEAAKL